MKNKLWTTAPRRYVYKKDHFCPSCKAKLLPKRVKEIVNSKSSKAKDFDLSAPGGGEFLIGDVEISYVLFECPDCKKRYKINEMREIERADKISSLGVTKSSLLLSRFISAIFIYVALMCDSLFLWWIVHNRNMDASFSYLAITCMLAISVSEVLRIIKISPHKDNLENKKLSDPYAVTFLTIMFQFLIISSTKKWILALIFIGIVFGELYVMRLIHELPIIYALMKKRKKHN